METASRACAFYSTRWLCPTCDAVEGHGIESLPDPEALLAYAIELEQLAEEIKTTDLAARLRR